MIIIKKGKLIAAVFFSFLLILLVAIWGYRIGMQSQLKSASELILFFGFIAAGLQFVLLIAVLVYAKQKKNDFLMLTKAIQLNGVLSESRAKKLGNLGFALREALDEAYKISEQKSVKIAGLNGLVSDLLHIIDLPLVVVNLTGEILDFSPKAQASTGCKKGDLLTEIAPSVSIKEAFQKAVQTRSATQQGEDALCHPVFSTTGTLSFFLVDLSQQPIITKVMENVKHLMQKTEMEKKNWNPLRKLLKK
ncbi:hypothetical protein [Treponema sp.]|uniref:hypothetical protein n=1 Tax=Treponema sp. TaxID=166 RepID=UPI003FA2ED97